VEFPGVIAYLLYQLGGFFTRILPLALIYPAAAVCADLNFLVNARSRRAVLSNLAHVRGSAPAAESPVRVARRVFHHFAYNIVDFLRLPAMNRERLAAAIDIDGFEHLATALARGRGVILLSGHIGNWEWGGAYFALAGIHVKAVALPHGAGRVTRFFDERRRAKGIEVLPFAGSTFAMVETLHRGGVVGLIVDRDYAHQGIPLRFFDAPTMVPRAHALLALKTGAALVPGFCLRGPGGRHRLLLRPPIPVADLESLAPEARVEALAGRCLREFEAVIGAHPDQWLVFAPIWPAAGGARP
jgi:KDO2-lipid IV(A) lauroyltransferase